MGITINYRLAQEKKYIKRNLDELEAVASAIRDEQAKTLGISMEVRRLSEQALYIDIGNCETLAFEFKTFGEWEVEKKDWSYQMACIGEEPFLTIEKKHSGEHYERWPDQKLVWCAEFCKTQFSEHLVEHKWCADLVRLIASRCVFANVNDEGDYLHSGVIEDAAEAIGELGKMINGIGAQLSGLGWDAAQVVKGGETKVKPIRSSKKN